MRLPFLLPVVAALCLAPGCGLVLDYDPPSDGGMDAPIPDAPAPDGSTADAPSPSCRTDLDCDDGNACDGVERCVDQTCVEGTAMACPDDEDVCDGVSSCDPASGLCVVSAAETCEDDGDPCNGVEQCDPVLGCVVVSVPDCDDGIDCTIDACAPRDGCTHTPDDTVCGAMAGGVCTDIGCRYPTCSGDSDCRSDDACFDGTCDEGMCVFAPRICSAGTECCAGDCVPVGCDDGNECTDDHCGRRRGCVNTPRAGSCSDGNGCTLNDVCVEGTCTGGPRRACISTGTDMCRRGVCDDATGECTTMPLDGAPCVDSNYCTINDVCVAGVCTSGSTAPDCDDGEFCTADSCDVNAGCEHIPLRDGLECPGIVPSTCMAGRCVGAITTDCTVGTYDCDGDGRCECSGPCMGTLCASEDAACLGGTRCSGGQRCCDVVGAFDFGVCVPSTCVTCCTIR